MNKKVLTLCAAMLLGGSFSTMYATNVTTLADLNADATTHVVATVSDNVITFTGDITLDENTPYLVIDQAGVTIDGNHQTLNGRLVITAEGVTVKNLTINNIVKTNNGSYWKNGITVVASNVTLTGNTIVCGVTEDAGENAMANGISIFPTAETVEYNITGNTVKAANAVAGQWQSSGILISEGIARPDDGNKTTSVLKDFDASTIANNNSFEECAGDLTLYNYTEGSTGYKYISVAPLKDQSGKIQNESYITSMIESATEGATVVFKGTSDELLDALVASDVDLSDADAAVQIVGREEAPVEQATNLLFGDAKAPNGNPSSNVVLSSEGKVTEDVQTSATPYIGGYALLEKDGSGYYMLGVLGTDGETQYVVDKDGNLVEFEPSYATNAEYLWDMQESKDPVTGIYSYRFQNKATEGYLTSTDDAATGTTGSFSQISGAAYNNGLYMNVGADAADGPLNKAEKNYWGLYETGEKAFTAAYLNELEGDSFSLTIKDNTGKIDALEGEDAFASSIKAVPTSNSIDEEDATSYYFMVGDKYIALDKEDTWSKNGVLPEDELGYKFKTISQDTYNRDKDRYELEFTINYEAGLNTDKDANPTNKTAIKNIEIGGYYLSTYSNDEKNYLTVSRKENLYATITFGGEKRADIAELLTGQFVNIQFVNKQYKEDADGNVIADQRYKKDGNGVLAVEDYDPEYVPAANVLLSSPEAQWAIQYVADGTKGKATFVNRENPGAKVESITLYETDEKDVYAVTYVGSSNSNVAVQDTIKLTFVKNHTKFDGFKVVDVNALPDTVYNIAAYKAINNVNDAYWVEKNHSTTHQIGLDGDIENAGEWNLHVATKKLLDEDGEEVLNAKGENVYVPDTVFVVSEMSYIDPKTKTVAADFKKDTLAILPYAIQNNDNREFVKYDGTHGVDYYVADKNNKVNPGTETKDGVAPADNFALKMKPDGTYQIISLTPSYPATTWAGENAVVMSGKVYAGSSPTAGILGNTSVYAPRYNDLMLITPVAMPEYRPVIKANEAAFDTVRIYRDENHSQLLYEKKDQKSGISFLNIDNENQFELADAIFVDTAYVNRGNNTRWQYLLVVQPNNVSEWYCPVNEEHNTEAWREENGVAHCHDAIRKNYVEGRFLVNLMDTANIYETTTQHENPYVNEVEAGVYQAKLAFVPGKHFGDSLVIYKDAAMTEVKDSLFLGESDFNIAKFAFRYVDNEAGSFKIQTQWKNWKDGDLRVETETSNEGYLRWENGTVVVAPSYEEGDVFNMTENYVEGNPTANETIAAEGAVSVTATDGAVIIKGAEGKNVVIATILGKVVANETINSDNETIAVPAGIAVVSVDGESFKVVVK